MCIDGANLIIAIRFDGNCTNIALFSWKKWYRIWYQYLKLRLKHHFYCGLQLRFMLHIFNLHLKIVFCLKLKFVVNISCESVYLFLNLPGDLDMFAVPLKLWFVSLFVSFLSSRLSLVVSFITTVQI